jgi:cysteine synthase B
MVFVAVLLFCLLAVLICGDRMTLLRYQIAQAEIPNLAGLEAQVGNTPLLPLRRVTARLAPRVQVFAKAEWFNPGGSIKDRPALNIIRRAIANGDLHSGRRLLDSTSGNMGIAYATFGASLGIPVTLAIPSNASPERISILRALGAELILTDPLEGTDGATRKAHRLAAERPDLYWYANQYDNPANWMAHYRSTGPEIWSQTGGQVTYFVAGLGTSGTMTGVGRFLHEQDPSVHLVAVQPEGPLHGLEGLKNMETAIQPGIYDPTLQDEIVRVSTEDAYQMVRRLAREEGLFVGISSGAAAVAALRIAEGLDEGIVTTIFPDAGYKYLSEENLWQE